MSAIRAPFETEIDGFRANKSSRILPLNCAYLSNASPSFSPLHRVSMERIREETRRMCFELQAWKGRREKNSIACFDEEKVNSLRAHFLVDDVNKRKSLEKYKYKFLSHSFDA